MMINGKKELPRVLLYAFEKETLGTLIGQDVPFC